MQVTQEPISDGGRKRQMSNDDRIAFPETCSDRQYQATVGRTSFIARDPSLHYLFRTDAMSSSAGGCLRAEEIISGELGSEHSAWSGIVGRLQASPEKLADAAVRYEMESDSAGDVLATFVRMLRVIASTMRSLALSTT